MCDVIKKIPIIAVVGPTASGKTAVAIELAKLYNAEIISADSMQIYKGMDIASAKPSQREQMDVRHHLIDFLEPTEKYSVARYIKDATNAVNEIYNRGKNIILCGGTGLYIDSFLDNIVFEEQPNNSNIREELLKRKQTEGIESIYSDLMKVDEVTAKSLHINNEGRILRAYETYLLTGEKPSVLKERSRQTPSRYDVVYICLQYRNRDNLYERINNRVDLMISKGLVDEAKEYFSLDNKSTSSQAIGHKELVPFLLGEISLDVAVENLKQATRNYAKRQLTWFRRNKNINSIFCDDYECIEEVVSSAKKIIDNSEIFKEVIF